MCAHMVGGANMLYEYTGVNRLAPASATDSVKASTLATLVYLRHQGLLQADPMRIRTIATAQSRLASSSGHRDF